MACQVSITYDACNAPGQRVYSPRDAVTISRTFNDATTLIDISTSLPRSPDEPTYLRPSPPYVRSDVARECALSATSTYIIKSCQCLLGASSAYKHKGPSRTSVPAYPDYASPASGNITSAWCGALGPPLLSRNSSAR